MKSACRGFSPRPLAAALCFAFGGMMHVPAARAQSAGEPMGSALRLSPTLGKLPSAVRLPAEGVDRGVQPRLRLGRTLFDAAAEADAPEPPVPFDPRSRFFGNPSEKTNEVAAARSESAADTDGDEEGWLFSPVRWRGNLSNFLNSLDSDDGARSVANSRILSVNANSFFLAPYIAQIGSNFSISQGDVDSRVPGGSEFRSDADSHSVGLSANIFPVSRFPLVASAGQTRSSTSSASSEGEPRAVRNSTTGRYVALRQQYTTPDARDRYGAGLNWSSYTSALADSATTNLFGSFSTTRKYDDEDDWREGMHTLSASFNYSDLGGSFFGQREQSLNLGVNHGWRVHEDLGINNSITVAREASSIAYRTLGEPVESRNQVVLMSSSFNWKPYEDVPLQFNGSGNLIQTGIEIFGNKTDTRFLGGFFGASYRYTENLLLSGNLGLFSTQSGGVDTLVSSQTVNATYTATPISFAGFDYGWGAATGTANTYTRGAEGFSAQNVSLNHNVGRSFDFGAPGRFNITVSQSLARIFGKVVDARVLTHTLGTAWSANVGDSINGNLGVNLSDSRSDAKAGDARYRTASVIGNGSIQITPRANFSFNASLSWTQSVDARNPPFVVGIIGVDPSRPQVTGTAGLSYSHQTPFGINNLHYSASALWVNSQNNQQFLIPGSTIPGTGVPSPGQPGINPNDPSLLFNQVQRSQSFQQLLEYRIGKLAFRLNYALIEQAGKESASIYASVGRDFDGFFDGRF